MSTSLRPPVAHAAVEQLAKVEPLDEPAKFVGKFVRDTIPKGPVKDTLSGTWLGHALHPLLTDLPDRDLDERRAARLARRPAAAPTAPPTG